MPRGRPSRVTVYQRLEEAVAELRERLGGLPTPTEAEDIWADIWHQEAHNSTAIEGNTLVLREVERLLEEGKAVGSKPLRDYMEVRGYGDAAQWVYGQALEPGEWNNGELLTLHEVRSVHYMAMTPVWTVDPHPHAADTDRPKLLFPDMKLTIHPVLDEGGHYPHHNLYFVISDVWDLKVLGGLLLSKVAEAFVEAYAVKMRGGTLRFQAQYLRKIRIPAPPDIDPQTRTALARAFDARDIEAATNAALRAYGLEDLPD